MASPAACISRLRPGVYHERVIVTQNHTNITLVGMGKSPADVVITNSLNAKQAGGTFFTETVEINGDGFEADNLTFENTAGNTGQAVAAAVRADRAVFKNCRFLGHQDTLFADYGRQYYVDSYIEGGVDFIFGNAAAVFDHTELHANGPGYLTAQSRTSAGSDDRLRDHRQQSHQRHPGRRAARHRRSGTAVAAIFARGVYRYGAARRCDPAGLERMGKNERDTASVLCGVRVEGAGRECGGARCVVASTDGARGGAVQAAGVSGGEGPLEPGSRGGEAAVRRWRHLQDLTPVQESCTFIGEDHSMPTETTYTELRENLASYLDRVVDDREVVVVKRRGARDVAIIAAR